jgi:reactive intermediate/imine deaminase|tara:strand:+ start:2045 stop:2440 length:396 start_codon:yes stop_codon:yes gene_type:complete
MVPFESITTTEAPAAIGTYSQAIRCDDTVYLSGQIPLDPTTMELVSEGMDAQITQVFTNLQAVCHAAGGSLEQIVKLTVYLTDLEQFARVNEIMTHFFELPYPARAVIGVSALPRQAEVEVDAVMVLSESR